MLRNSVVFSVVSSLVVITAIGISPAYAAEAVEAVEAVEAAQDAKPDPPSAPAPVPPVAEEKPANSEDADHDHRSFAANIGELTGLASSAAKTFTLGGYVETFYQWNFNNPSNGITAFRGFDNRHNTFTVANAVIDVGWDYKDVVGRVALQIGHTPSTYYASEPARAGTSTVNATHADLWKYIQQAYTGYRFNVGRGLLVTGGIFLTPIGPEGIPIRDNWNWSRSNLFFGLPYYHTGVRAAYALDDRWTLTLAGYNGYNSVVDNNSEKSASATVTYTVPNQVALSMIYFGGVERDSKAPEGRAWRHLFDLYGTWFATPSLTLMAHMTTGFEPNNFGTSAWWGTALYARMRIMPQLYFVARGDAFYEYDSASAFGRAAPMFWPVNWVGSGTATLEYKPHERVSFRLEYRHDHATKNLYFAGHGDVNVINVPFAANRNYQDTLTLGATTWF